MPGPQAREELEGPIEAVLLEAGFELVALKLVPRGGELAVQIFIDHLGLEDILGQEKKAVTLGDCARLSRLVQERVDLERQLSGRYVLEVSSPGLDRPLTRPGHYRRFRGERVAVQLKTERSGQRVLHGTIGEADEEGVTLELEGGGSERLRFADLAGGRLKVDVWKESRARGSGREE